jgi:dihydrofolate reductase
MRKILLLIHTSLDGFVAGLNGEMDWIHIDDEMFDEVGKLTQRSDTVIYGRVTFEMMESYWPTAGQKPNASRHDIEHSRWTNDSLKIVLSRTRKETSWKNSKILSDNIPEQIQQLKQQPGKDMLMIGSATSAQLLMQEDLIDEYWISVNPVMLGNGIPLFRNDKKKIDLKLIASRNFNCGATVLHYEALRGNRK